MEAMKVAFIVVEGGAEPDVMQALEDLGLEHHTRVRDVTGSGETGRKQGTPVFPGLNTLLIVALPADKVEPMVEALHQVRASFTVPPGLKIIVSDCEVY